MSKKGIFFFSSRKKFLRMIIIISDMPVCLIARDGRCIVRGIAKFGCFREGFGLDLIGAEWRD